MGSLVSSIESDLLTMTSTVPVCRWLTWFWILNILRCSCTCPPRASFYWNMLTTLKSVICFIHHLAYSWIVGLSITFLSKMYKAISWYIWKGLSSSLKLASLKILFRCNFYQTFKTLKLLIQDALDALLDKDNTRAFVYLNLSAQHPRLQLSDKILLTPTHIRQIWQLQLLILSLVYQGVLFHIWISISLILKICLWVK